MWLSIYKAFAIAFVACCLHSLSANDSAGELWLIVNAPHLDYSSFNCLLKTLAKHPRTGCKEGHFGHAWIRLHGYLDGHYICIEGGHSGDRGLVQPRYVDGLMNLIEFGTLYPEREVAFKPEPNPIRYLWETQRDGYFQIGSGGFHASYAVAIPLNSAQLRCLIEAIQHYPYDCYSLTSHQCVEFVRYLASITGRRLPDCRREVAIPCSLSIGSLHLPLWQDRNYCHLGLATADDLESALKELVRSGQASNVTKKYRLLKIKKLLPCLKKAWYCFNRFPDNYRRWCLFKTL